MVSKPRASAPVRAGGDSGPDRADLEQIREIVRSAVQSWVSPSDLEDIQQTAFIRLSQSISKGRVRVGDNITAYLKAIARNIARDLKRRRRRELLVSEPPDTPGLPCGSVTDDGMRSLERYLRHLSPSLRSVFEARYILELSQSRAAELLKLSRQAVRTLETRLKRGALDWMREIPGSDEAVASDEDLSAVVVERASVR